MECPCNYTEYERGYSIKCYLSLKKTNTNGEDVFITDDEFKDFIKSHIASVFPDGFTVYTTIGGFKKNGITLIEPTNILEVLTMKECRYETINKFSELIKKYSEKFGQCPELITVSDIGFYAK